MVPVGGVVEVGSDRLSGAAVIGVITAAASHVPLRMEVGITSGVNVGVGRPVGSS